MVKTEKYVLLKYLKWQNSISKKSILQIIRLSFFLSSNSVKSAKENFNFIQKEYFSIFQARPA